MPEILSEEELHALFAVLPCWRDRTLVLLMWISCLRISEALALRFQDVECSQLRLQVACGKGGHPRTVYMDRYTFAALNTYLDEERGDLFPEVEELFVAFKGVARGRPLSVNAVQHSLDYYAAKCGIGLHAHLLRHTGITQLVQQGMSEPAIRKLVGHRHAQSLEPYLHLSDRFVQAEFEQAQAALQPLEWLPYRQKIEQAMRDLGYRPGNTSSMLNLLLWVLAISGKALEELTRADFDPFAEASHAWYRKAWANGRLNPRLMRLEKVLVQWVVLPARGRVFRHEEHAAALRQETFRAAILRYLQWCEVRYQPSTIDNARAALLSFFLWLQEQEPGCGRLDGVSRSVALSYGQHLKAQGEAGRYSASYQRELHTYIRQFFDFAIDERLATSPDRNPFSVRDLPRPQEMIPRYLSDQELRTILTYCEGQASLFERTIVITLLHTGVRAMELTQLKASDIVQIGGVWKLHIHLGKGLKDRLIPLTPHCLSALQAWQERGWERISDALFTTHGRPYLNSGLVTRAVHELGRKLGIPTLTAHRFRHTFAVALLNYGIRESALQKLMGHATLGMTLEYARILDQTVEQSFSQALEQMQEGPHSWIPTFFVQEEYTLFAQGDTVSWIRLPVGYCRRNPKLHCESDVKCLLCGRFAASREDLPRLRQMQERFRSLGLQLKADVVAAQIHRLETSPAEAPPGFIPLQAISTATRR